MGVVEETLRRLGRNETVLGMREGLAAGPLHDVDSGAASRVEWWTRILGEVEPGAPTFDDSDLWAHVRVASEPVVLWHGPHPGERLFVLRACWHLRDQADRVHEVALPVRASRHVPPFYGAVGIVGPDSTTKEWGRLSIVADVAARARRWEELRDQPGDGIRVLQGDDLVQLPVTAFDADLVKACSDGKWSPSLTVVARVLADNPTSDSLLTWRVRELLRTGALEARGDLNRLGLPTEVRPVP